MLFGRLRVPFERLAAESREGLRADARASFAPLPEWACASLHGPVGPRGDSPRRCVVPTAPPRASDDYTGLERLDREELDEEPTP